MLGLQVFEPVTIFTNFLIGAFCAYAFLSLSKNKEPVFRHWRSFFFMIGLSSTLGSVAHGAHDQFGEAFLNFFIFSMNAVSLIAAYYFFRSAFSFIHFNKENINNTYQYLVVLWVIVLLIITWFQNKFILIKIHAGIVLFYSLFIHFITARKGLAGSQWVVTGILVSFSSIVVHSLKLSVSDWFNYKDISHLIMLSSCVLMHRGVKQMAAQLSNISELNALKE